MFLKAPWRFKKNDFFTNGFSEFKKFSIGDFTYGKPKVLFPSEEATLVVGRFCSIAEDVQIFLGGNHRTDWVSTYPFSAGSLNEYFPEASNIKGHPGTKGGVTIGNDVWIGDHATIMSGVAIGNGAVIAAHSVVSKNIGDYEVWAGNPARFIRKRFTDDQIKQLNLIQWWNWDIRKIKSKVGLLCSDNIDAFVSACRDGGTDLQ